ncbi:MAG TPA: hypothetical protein VGL71_01855 [Urbifossiella sp.]
MELGKRRETGTSDATDHRREPESPFSSTAATDAQPWDSDGGVVGMENGAGGAEGRLEQPGPLHGTFGLCGFDSGSPADCSVAMWT